MQARIAVSRDFMESYSRLPGKVQKKVREFTERFQRDPTEPGLNFEHYHEARDPKVRSVRIGLDYRMIVIQPPRGDVFLCVWVDHHDEAYRWAQNRCFEVNPHSGTFQIFGVEDAHEPPKAAGRGELPKGDRPDRVRTSTQSSGLFAAHDDDALLLAGVPQPLLASVRALRAEADLDALAPHLPPDASEMLYLLAAGYSLDEAIDEADRSQAPSARVDVEDFGKSLARPGSQELFKMVADGSELDAILEAPLERWRVFLHPSQRRLVTMQAAGPVRVLGGAGTGKTVVLMHRARQLAETRFTGEHDRILVTTFTKNLALDLETNLRNLCSRETFARIEVKNLHSWIAAFMRKQGAPLRIVPAGQRRRLFQAAFDATCLEHPRLRGFSLDFYMDEWDVVVQAQEVQSRDDYLTARRVGRSARLSRRQRAEVWAVLAAYRERLQEAGCIEWPDAMRETRLYIEKQGVQLPYRAVLSDEVQDFGAPELRLLRTLAPQAPDSLFLVGDGHQRIYGQPVRLGACGIEIRGRSRRLKLNYRTTEQIRTRGVAVLEGCEIDDLDGARDSMRGAVSLRHGPPPEIRHFRREAEEAAYLLDRVKRWSDEVPPEEICIAVRTQGQIDNRYRPLLEQSGVSVVQVQTEPESEAKQPGVRIATMHRLKGLEFARVILAGVQEGTVPLDVSRAGEAADGEFEADVQRRHELRERCLLYVACTRARDQLAIAGYGTRSSFLAGA